MNYFFSSNTNILPINNDVKNILPINNDVMDIITDDTKKKLSFNTIRGTTIKSTDKFCTKEISIANLIECYNKEIIIIPTFQRLVDNDKIQSMIKEYYKCRETFNYLTNPIQLVKLIDDDTSTLFLIDGQHRFFMYQDLYNNSYNGFLNINIIKCNTVDEMLDIYINFNRDNHDLHFDKKEIIDHQLKSRYIIFRDKIHKLYKKYFKQNDDYIYSVEGFVKMLELHEYLEYFDSVNDAIDFMNERNYIYYKNYYKNKNIELFSKKEKELIQNEKIMTLRKNNFIEFLMNDESDVPSFNYSHAIIKKKSNNI